MPSQSSFDGPLAEAVAGLMPVTIAAHNIARPDTVAIHRRALRGDVSAEAELVDIVYPCGWRVGGWRVVGMALDGEVVELVPRCIGRRRYLLERP